MRTQDLIRFALLFTTACGDISLESFAAQDHAQGIETPPHLLGLAPLKESLDTSKLFLHLVRDTEGTGSFEGDDEVISPAGADSLNFSMLLLGRGLWQIYDGYCAMREMESACLGSDLHVEFSAQVLPGNVKQFMLRVVGVGESTVSGTAQAQRSFFRLLQRGYGAALSSTEVAPVFNALALIDRYEAPFLEWYAGQSNATTYASFFAELESELLERPVMEARFFVLTRLSDGTGNELFDSSFIDSFLLDANARAGWAVFFKRTRLKRLPHSLYGESHDENKWDQERTLDLAPSYRSAGRITTMISHPWAHDSVGVAYVWPNWPNTPMFAMKRENRFYDYYPGEDIRTHPKSIEYHARIFLHEFGHNIDVPHPTDERWGKNRELKADGVILNSANFYLSEPGRRYLVERVNAIQGGYQQECRRTQDAEGRFCPPGEG